MVDVPLTLEAELLTEKSFDASDKAQVNEARKRAGRKTKEKFDFIKHMMDSPQGRKYFFDFMESCAVFSNPLVPQDTHATYYHLGRQSVGKQILSEVQQFPDLYVLMMQESK